MVVDASVWVSYHLFDDVNHTIAVAWLDKNVPQGASIAIPVSALAEIAGAVTRRSGQASLGWRAAWSTAAVPRLQIVEIEESLGLFAAHVAADYRLRGADAMYVAVAARLGVPLVTFDNEQASRAAAAVEVISPF
jgi:predicted nucleic acid-binding protein